MLVLTLDTSTPTVTAGLVRLLRPHEIAERLAAGADGQSTAPAPLQVIAEHTVTDAFGHAEHLMPLVTAALDTAGCRMRDIEAIVAGLGPGPFTGLRVGLATAAALGEALSIPVHGVPSHDAVARVASHGAPNCDADARVTGAGGPFLVVTDARRREVYLSAYSEAAARVLGPAVLAPAAIGAVLVDHDLAPAWITGAGAALAAAHLDLPERQSPCPVSAGLVSCAATTLLTGAVPGPLSPLYLRRPDATEPTRRKSVLGATTS